MTQFVRIPEGAVSDSTSLSMALKTCGGVGALLRMTIVRGEVRFEELGFELVAGGAATAILQSNASDRADRQCMNTSNEEVSRTQAYHR
jgi:hypothetical protein